ncbi:hypothetical protein BaRGS_00001795 [Batillaria attramentaria]|uniref:Uncharacterized protein n=1 Tax=Batillaria attramentaria TaxID=370345 RepID=A0ABD0M4V6_9CAEN
MLSGGPLNVSAPQHSQSRHRVNQHKKVVAGVSPNVSSKSQLYAGCQGQHHLCLAWRHSLAGVGGTGSNLRMVRVAVRGKTLTRRIVRKPGWVKSGDG